MNISSISLEVQKLAELSQKIGQNIPFWTQGAGGNCSVKSGQHLIIKASGFKLADITTTHGLVEVQLPNLLQNLNQLIVSAADDQEAEKQYASILTSAKLEPDSPLRPSMEAGFHALLETPFVAHFHSLVSLLVFEKWKQSPLLIETLLTEFFGPSKFVFIPFCLPGLELTKAVAAHKDRQIFFLQNHGVILAGEDLDILSKFKNFEDRFCQEFNFAELLLLKKSNLTFDELTKKFLRGPLKIYFPDTAIVLRELYKHLIPSNDLFELSKDANSFVADIWLATQILFSSCPELSTIGEQEIEKITTMPTEKLRQQFFAKNEAK